MRLKGERDEKRHEQRTAVIGRRGGAAALVTVGLPVVASAAPSRATARVADNTIRYTALDGQVNEVIV